MSFISTEAATVLSFICRTMPNLLKCIVQYSDSTGKKISALPSLILLSSQQVMDAKEHPSEIVQQALVAIAYLQLNLNTATNYLDKLVTERHEIESLLANMLATTNK